MDPACPLCRAAHAQSLDQTLVITVNRAFNSAFTLLSGGGPLSDVFTGALVLVRRSLFFVPEGVTASTTTNGLTVNVNSGSVAYFRQNGSGVQVSGDPGFWNATTYTSDHVAVAGAGNGGAGVVLTSGTIAGDLTTDQIDAVRFESGSAFTGKVAVTATGLLTLRDGVRGLAGVALNAPAIVLDNNVEIDGGSGDAAFAGTVDAARAGKQSLTVTALGTTTFAGDVGATAALSSLLTQGIAPLAITQSNNTKTIALHFLPWVENPVTGTNEVKYGIDVAVGGNPSQVYEFDTGGNGFFAGYNQPFWQGVPITSDPVSILFTSGNQFNAVVATPTVTIGQGNHTVTTAPIDVGAILSGSSPKTGTFVFTDPAAPPIEGSFFGDFGASLAVLPVSGTSYLLANPLLQLPGNLSNGYLVQLGPIGVTPQVTVGLTDSLRAQFPYAVPIAPAPGGGTYPVSGLPQLNLFGIYPSYFAQESPTSPLVPIQQDGCGNDCALPTVIDSGAPSTSIRLGDQKGPFETPGGQLQPGVSFVAQFPTAEGKPPLTWTFVAGNNGSVNLVDYANSSAAFSGDNLNTGLNIYNNYDVMFDVQDQVLRLRPTGGQSMVIANSVTTTGTQTYRQNAELNGTYTTGGADFSVAGVTTLTGDTVINAGAGNVTFSGNVDSPTPAGSDPATPMALTVNSSGTTTFARPVGSLSALSSLTTDAGGRTDSFQVDTVGTQNYGDDVTLQGKYVTQQGSFLVSGDTILGAGVSVQALDNYSQYPPQPGGITFSGKVDSQPGRGYTLDLQSGGGKMVLVGDVGSTNPLGGLTAESAGAPAGTNPEFVASGRITMDGSLGFANDNGLVISDGVTTKLTSGGLITNFGNDGILVTSQAGTQVSGFAVSGSGSANIATDGAANVTITNNAVSGGAGSGVDLKKSTAVTLSGNSIRGAGGAGLRADQLHNSIISNNTIAANTGEAVRLTNSANVTVSGNTVNSNGSDGVYADGLTDSSISGNNITANQGNGIYSTDSTTIQIVSNTISGNGFNGVSIDKGSTGNAILSNSISGNDAAKAGGLGISLNNGDGNDGQAAPREIQAVQTGASSNELQVSGKLNPQGYTGEYTVQVFYSPATDAPNIEGQQFLGQEDVSLTGQDFSFSLPLDTLLPAGYITVTATPKDGAPNTSEFSNGAALQ
ncbi:hypothetical protein Y900_017255 [Mycolicibacterium aromaticivorans JS19b1 = JCM 16368]|uniref:Right handed beta helix domain-containing protein n=1 Tax=Mycolicibacterium aromaticivorans JS19b1 = JCM 16368 TaxID=1440774 RepID=A0A064CP97_9MYCO|nr:hypothetical protein Y900_017255 [Mycolicibacterium aromaticivorans JS19b1 = JCM 16368]